MTNVVPFQINKDGKVSCRKDRTLNKRKLERVLRKALGKENLEIISLHPKQKMVTAIYNDCDKKTLYNARGLRLCSKGLLHCSSVNNL